MCPVSVSKLKGWTKIIPLKYSYIYGISLVRYVYNKFTSKVENAFRYDGMNLCPIKWFYL